jgi:hypothetical protein
MRYFFHVKDGKEMFDQEGVELLDLSAVKEEAVKASTELLEGLHEEEFWNGEPWKLWVTDKPNGIGNIILTLTFTAQISALSESKVRADFVHGAKSLATN